MSLHTKAHKAWLEEGLSTAARKAEVAEMKHLETELDEVCAKLGKKREDFLDVFADPSEYKDDLEEALKKAQDDLGRNGNGPASPVHSEPEPYSEPSPHHQPEHEPSPHSDVAEPAPELPSGQSPKKEHDPAPAAQGSFGGASPDHDPEIFHEAEDHL